MKYFILFSSIVIILISGCVKDIQDKNIPNKPPNTFLWLFPDSSIAQGISKQHIHWWGDDPDGIIKGYLFAFDTIRFYDSTGIIYPSANAGWRWRDVQDTIISFPLIKKYQTFFVAVKAVDNSFISLLSDQAMIRFTSTDAYWDKNENGVFDSLDEVVKFPLNSIDQTAATLDMPTRNQPPSVAFAPNPANPVSTMQQPETTYTAVTFGWIGTDPDGDKTIVEYRINLNNPSDSTKWVTLPANVVRVTPSDLKLSVDNLSLITLYVPRARSDIASGEINADLYSGTFFKRQKVGTIEGLKLDSLNTFYLQARDIAGDYSPVVRMPDTAKIWFVKKPRTRLLTIVDYINSDSAAARKTYNDALTGITLPSGMIGNYDELNVGRGISLQTKKDAADGRSNPRYGVLVPPFIDPAFTFTLFLFDYVFWYTDVYPSIPVAQTSLFHYYNTLFDGHKGKVIFSTSFEFKPDPLGLMRDFAPIDSISNVNLASATVQLPRFGDSRVPGDYELSPDSSVSADLYPVLKFNHQYSHLVYLRPIYRRSDARYIYRMQEDVQFPQRYAYTATLNELKSNAAFGNSGVICGGYGTILGSNDAGASWVHQKSGTAYSLNSVKLLDGLNGWIVGDSGTILHTNDGGIKWTSQSVLTYENLLGVDYVSSTNGIAVGTRGIILTTTNGGTKWESRSSPTRKPLRAVNFFDVNNGVSVGDTIILQTSDGGMTWLQSRGYPYRVYNSVHYRDASTVFAVGNNGALAISTDGGSNWSLQAALYGELKSISFADQNNGWICGKSGVFYRTVNGGQSWNDAPASVTNVTQHLNSLAFANSNEGWSVGTGAIILHTIDGGVNFSTQPKGYLNVGVIDGTKSFVFIGLPLHLLNGNPAPNTDGGYLKPFFEHILLKEFAQ